MIKIHFSISKNIKAKKFSIKILKKIKNFSVKSADVIVVCGGDGYMLKTIKKLYKYKKPFYGINCGSFGFLMNRINSEKLTDRIKKSKKIDINPLSVKAVDSSNKRFNLIAINEASLFRQSKQTASISISLMNKKILKKLVGDGILISTPAGSTAYNLSVNGPILSLVSGKFAVTPISPFRPRRWKGKVISNRSVIKVKNLNHQKRPLALVADNIERRNIKYLEVKNNKKIKISLLYDRGVSLINKIKSEQKKNKNF